jgi:hypothetical protein
LRDKLIATDASRSPVGTRQIQTRGRKLISTSSHLCDEV